jgi:hypothetical protein
MDRSFLSQANVVAVSRSFICIRLATYENQREHDFLKKIGGTGRSGEVENTVFGMLSPDGKKRLTRVGRSARHEYSGADALAEDMQRIAKGYSARKGDPALPYMADLRLALNVAACDQRPLVVLVDGDRATKAKLEAKVATLAWSDRFIGRFVFVRVPDARSLKNIAPANADSDLLVIQPDRFGQRGTILAQAPAAATSDHLATLLTDAEAKHRGEPAGFHEHVREGHRLGLFWETLLPVTDPMEARARSRKPGPPQPPR